ncbi:MAG: rhomboid family intramembrane serine protease [Sphingobacteriales bacterium]|nr:MAG: rhomboid family intramembrane serine protease [Sphingobacteriales bacterium]
MSQQFRNIGGASLPPVIKNLIIINALMFLLTLGMERMNINLTYILGLFPWESPFFRPWQLITHMFMHSTENFAHIIFNMLALWMIGTPVENVLGTKKFLLLYFISGLGAALCQMLVSYFTQTDINVPMVGASGAVYGALFAFGYMFPNSIVQIYFLIPMKAKYFVAILAVIGLVSGISNSPGDNVAHFAHLGGMLFAFFLLAYWKNKGKLFLR